VAGIGIAMLWVILPATVIPKMKVNCEIRGLNNVTGAMNLYTVQVAPQLRGKHRLPIKSQSRLL